MKKGWIKKKVEARC